MDIAAQERGPEARDSLHEDANDGARDRRRWSDRPGRIPALTFARFLATRPEMDEVTRFLVGLLSWPIAASGAFVVRVQGDDITIRARYDELTDADGLSDCDGEWEVAAIRDLLAGTSGQPVLHTEDDFAGCRPMAAWPLGGPPDSHCYLVLTLAACMPERLVAERVMGIPDVLALYDAALHATSRPTEHGVAPHLSPRQLTVLQLLARDLTMQQISVRIGFSESTVRMDSLAIYRALGVHDRRQAVATGEALGLIEVENVG